MPSRRFPTNGGGGTGRVIGGCGGGGGVGFSIALIRIDGPALTLVFTERIGAALTAVLGLPNADLVGANGTSWICVSCR